jgi:streptogramin lyase
MTRHWGAVGGVCALLASLSLARAEVIDSGWVERTGAAPAVVFSATAEAAGATSVYVSFHDVLLSGDEASGTGAYLVLTALADGGVQTLHASHVAQWRNRSAFFNGAAVQMEVVAYPGRGPNRIVFELLAAEAEEPARAGVSCAGRTLSNDPRSGRTLNAGGGAGCTAFIIDDACHCLLTAGHCAGSELFTVEFNVPLSDASGNIVHPPPEHQYAVDRDSRRFPADLTQDGDWCTFGCFPNSTTGLTPFEAQGACYPLAAAPPPVDGRTIRVTGYGATSAPLPATWNRAQQTSTGTYSNFYAGAGGPVVAARDVNVSGGDSGSAFFDQDACQVIGIIYAGGCGPSEGMGTAVNNLALQAALADPRGVCVPDCNANGLPDPCDLACGPLGGPCDVAGCGLSADCTGNGVPDECEPDCNTNGVPDSCDILGGTSPDCSGNGVPDACEPDCNTNGVADSCDLESGTSRDCNCTGVPDECEIAHGISADCNRNGGADECEPDCNANGVPDECDVDAGDPDGNGQVSTDCNANGLPDECEVDCNTNGVPDACDLAAGTSADCAADGTPDECEPDCNANGVADSCDLLAGTSPDCDTNGIPDECETDCNTNGVPDACDLAAGTSADCNANGVPDECDVGPGSSPDCNANGTPDACEPDCNANGVPDDCDVAGYGDLFVAGFRPSSGKVDQFDSGSGTFLRIFIPLVTGELMQPLGMTFHPHGDLLVGDAGPALHSVRRYDGVTGALRGDFVAAQAGGLFSPWDLTIGPNGNLFVANVGSGGVGITGILEYDGQTGAAVGTFAATGLVAPYGLAFGPNGDLFVCDHQTREVVEFDGGTGQPIRVFASPGGTNLAGPSALAFGPSGNLFVADEGSNAIVEFDGTTGAWIGRFVADVGAYGAASLMDLQFRPDGHLYVSHKETRSVYQYDASTGEWVASLPFSGFGVVKPFRLAFRPPLADCNGNLLPDTCDLADWNADGTVDLADYAGFQRCFRLSAAECAAAFDRAWPCGGGIDGGDYAVFHAQLAGPWSGR